MYANWDFYLFSEEEEEMITRIKYLKKFKIPKNTKKK